MVFYIATKAIKSKPFDLRTSLDTVIKIPHLVAMQSMIDNSQKETNYQQNI